MSRVQLADAARLCRNGSVWGHQLRLGQGGLRPGGPPQAGGGASSLQCVDLGDGPRVPRGEGAAGHPFRIGGVACASP